jgi:hypothetical protein
MAYTFTFTQEEVQIILLGLGELPLKNAVGLFSKMQQILAKKAQEEIDAAVDSRDMPSGQTMPPDNYRGD